MAVRPQRLIIFGASNVKIKAPTDDREIKCITSSPTRGETLILYEKKSGIHTELVSISQENGERVASGQAMSDFFKSKEISDTFGNSGQNFVLEKCGKVYGWGSNVDGQLGVGTDAIITVPTYLPLPTKEMVAQVACGESHTLILTKCSKLYAMGENAYGQLGLSKDERKIVREPSIVDYLQDVPVSQIVAGKCHSLCSTMSGRVFSWGRNDFGQLGLGTTEHGCTPKQIKNFNKPVAYISAGDNHNAFLTRAGELFTFGLGADGQLGHGDSCQNEVTPKIVEELEGSVVTQVACGKSHVVAYVPGCNQVFSFGCNTNGQLGFDCTKQKMTVPVMMSSLWHDEKKASKVEKIFASGNFTYIVLTLQSAKSSYDCRYIEPQRRILTLDEVSEILNLEEYDTDKNDRITPLLRSVMRSASCLNGSFVASDDRIMSHDFHGIDFLAARSAIERIARTGSLKMKKAVLEVLKKDLLPNLQVYNDVEVLKIYVILPICFEILMDDWMSIEPDELTAYLVVFAFIKKFLQLHSNAKSIVKSWYATLIPEDLLLSIKLCKRTIAGVIDKHYGEHSLVSFTKCLCICYPLQFLKFLEDINSKFKIVSYKEFYILNFPPGVLRDHYIFWKQKKHLESVMCEYPFVLDARAKNILLRIDAKQRTETSRKGIAVPPNILTVDRKDISGSSRKHINLFIDLRRPLQVRFKEEEGFDDGALSREYFMLVFDEVLKSPKNRLFIENEDSNLLWFSKCQPKDKLYKFTGKLCGLSFYNDVHANVNFPLALYKKLLGIKPNLDDLKELDPLFGNSLQYILEFTEDKDKTVEDEFGLVFITPEGYPLKKGGKEIPVTLENRGEYVSLCVDYVFQRSVKLQFDAFRSGFLEACEAKMLHIFRPEELMEMVAGVQDYDWNELKQNTVCQILTCKSSNFDATVQWFWEILHDMSPQEKQKFLIFLTGSDKIPITGLCMTILQVEECDNYLPVAQVCYNYLFLHSYSSKEILEKRLKLSMQCKGYHIK